MRRILTKLVYLVMSPTRHSMYNKCYWVEDNIDKAGLIRAGSDQVDENINKAGMSRGVSYSKCENIDKLVLGLTRQIRILKKLV